MIRVIEKAGLLCFIFGCSIATSGTLGGVPEGWKTISLGLIFFGAIVYFCVELLRQPLD